MHQASESIKTNQHELVTCNIIGNGHHVVEAVHVNQDVNDVQVNGWVLKPLQTTEH